MFYSFLWGQIRSETLPEPEALFVHHKMEAEKTKQVTLMFGRFLERGQISRKLELEKAWKRL